MGLFDLFNDLKEKSEKRKRADEYRRIAKRYVQDGEKIYNKAYSEVLSYSNEISYEIEQHYNYKQQILKEISSDVMPVLSKFNNFDIDKKVFDAPSINTSTLSSLSGVDMVGKLSLSLAPSFLIPSILDLFSDPDEEYWEARSQMEEAERFYDNMRYERDKLYNIKENLRTIRYYIYDEKQLLDNLMLKVRNISSQLKSSMNKYSFSQAEADYLKGVHKIAQNISKLLTTKFLNNDFTITRQYKQAFEKIKAIDNSLQSAPTISQGTEGIRKILEILDVINDDKGGI